jgi:hypothetical protein
MGPSLDGPGLYLKLVVLVELEVSWSERGLFLCLTLDSALLLSSYKLVFTLIIIGSS